MTSPSDWKMLLEERHKAARTGEKKAVEAKRSKEASEELRLKRFLAARSEASDRHLKQGLALLGHFNVFFLLNVDSYTRDDLMSMVAVKLCTYAVAPGLELESIALSALVNFFEGLRVTPSLLNELADPKARIFLSKRSGEWLIADDEYQSYLAGKNFHKVAEPLSQIAKKLTIAGMELQRVEVALQVLALLLMPENRSKAELTSDRRGAFLQGLLELANACARAALAENLEPAFVEDVLHPWRSQNRTPELHTLKSQQGKELEKLNQELSATQAEVTKMLQDSGALQTSSAIKARETAFMATLFLRLRILSVFQLQIVNVSAYNCTGRAIKLAAWLTKSTVTTSNTTPYLLLCLHEALISLGYDLNLLRELLHLWVADNDAMHPLLLRNGSDLQQAKQMFSHMRHLLKNVGATSTTATYIKYIKEHSEDQFAQCCLEFLENFPKSSQPDKPPIEASSPCSHPFEFRSIAEAILKLNDDKEHLEMAAIEKGICAITDWFLIEEASHGLHFQGAPSP